MPKSKLSRSALAVLLPLAFILESCGVFGPAPTPTALPPTLTPTPAGPETLNICAAEEPSSLYLYADNSKSARAIRQAIYDGPFDWSSYLPQAVILESVPSLDNGGGTVQAVNVQAGQTVVDADGQLRALQAGVMVQPAGCRDASCAVPYDGSELHMDQLTVTFKLKAGLTWSDGEPLTAADSVYSFELNGDKATPGDKNLLQHTASYAASDDTTVVWTGLPGFLDPNYQTNFWTPLPQHAWGSMAAGDLATADAAARTPLGWGPYVIDAWAAGDRISLTRNPNYAGAPTQGCHTSTI